MADYVKVRTHITGHERFLEAGAIARDLYLWGMLYAGHLETDGDIPMVALLASPWGAGGKKNVVVANKLVEVGLWERTERGYRICKWTAQGNVTKAELEEKRRFDRERKARQRGSRSEPCPTPVSEGCPTGTPSGFPSSSSTSLSGSGSREGVQGETGPPGWFGKAIETVEAQTGEKLRPAESWLRYHGHRRGKGIAPSQSDAVYWLTTVMVREARDERDKARRQAERDAKFDRQRAGPGEPGKISEADQRRFAEELRQRMAKRGAA